jgi:PAS domain S-box-containing protein
MSGSYSYKVDVWLALFTLALLIYLGSYSWRRRTIPAARSFTVVCVFAGLWTVGAIMETLASDHSGRVFWVKFQAGWLLPVVTSITCFVLQYAGLGRFLNFRSYVLLSLMPITGAVVMMTNDVHHLMWAGTLNSAVGTGSAGIMYWVLLGYGYLLTLIDLAVLVWLAVSSPRHRLPVAIMLMGQFVSRSGFFIDRHYPHLIGPGERALLVVGLTTLAFAIAFLRFHTLDPVAAARESVLDQMSEGLFVFDLQGRIVYVNPMAAAISGMPAKRLLQKHYTEVLPVDAGLPDQAESKKIGQTELVLGQGDSARQYHLSLGALKGRKNEPIGQLLLLRDVTEQKQAQGRIIEQQRLLAKLQEREQLARELHDGIGQIFGYVSLQAQTALKWMQDGKNEKAGSVLGRIVEVSKDAHADVRESILSLRAGPEKKGVFIPNLKNYLDRFQRNYGIRTELSVSRGINEDTFDPEVEAQLMRIIQEALTNARKHSGARNFRVSVELDSNKGCLTITDDGDGFDCSNPANGDGNHFGLVFMRERMEQIGGALNINSTPGGGTVLNLEVPIRGKGEKSG